MWQLIIVGLVLAVVLIFIGRHFARVVKSEESPCSCCSGSCPSGKKPETGVMASGCCGDLMDRHREERPS